MNKKISVIVPAYNVEKYLRRCLDSLVYQTYPHLEILVIDDGSTDGTRGIIEEYVSRFAGKVFLYAQENAGQAAARNNGISYATGEYIGFVDADDFVSPRKKRIVIWLRAAIMAVMTRREKFRSIRQGAAENLIRVFLKIRRSCG